MSLETPVAFLIFNRPHLTDRVFKAIAEARPKKLLIVADGPRTAEERQLCEGARAVATSADWDCEIRTNFADTNLGCRQRVSTGLNWVFSEVEEAIILEDDCLPAPSFFYFCEELLERYRHDERIMHISGDNFQNGQSRTPYSYYFSRYSHVWGWASWRRAWEHYDVEMKTWSENREMICALFDDPYEQKYWAGIFDKVYANEIDTWDYHWLYACLSQSGLSIMPNLNLVSNIGFDADATHTFNYDDPCARVQLNEIWEVSHPPYVMRHGDADAFTFNYIFGGKVIKEQAVPPATQTMPVEYVKNAVKRRLNSLTRMRS